MILFIASVAGLTLSAEQTNAAVYIVLGIVGLVGATLPDKIVEKPEEEKTESKPEEKEDDTRSGTSSGEDIGNYVTGSRSRSEDDKKANGGVEQKKETEVRQGSKAGNERSASAWRVEQRGNGFDIVSGGFDSSFGDK